MTGVGHAIVLTDDEVIAAALDRRTAWPTAIPSVRPDIDAVGEAAFRGRRSLAVRSSTLDQSEIVSMIAAVLAATTRATASVPGAGGTGGSQIVFHASDDRVVREAIELAGVHTFTEVGRPAAAQELIDLAASSPRPVIAIVTADRIEVYDDASETDVLSALTTLSTWRS